MSDTAPPPATVLALTESDQRFVLSAGLALGAVAGFAGHWVWLLVGDWGLIPFPTLVAFLFGDSGILPAVLRVIAVGLLGLIAGAAINIVNPVVTVTDSTIAIRTPTNLHSIARDEVGAVRRKGGKVTIAAPDGRHLYHGDIEGGAALVEETFRRHGYPWDAP